ncbi:MAG: hypothetical protein IKG81_09535 [Bacteroidales bacterium]|nr:hypothetical protein [Bacteroidales bacterium]
MKRTLLVSLSLLVLLAFTTTSCQKDSATTTSFTATMEQCQEQDGKTALTNGTMQWVSGDQIKVFGTAGSGIYQAAIRDGSTTFNLVSGDVGDAPYRAVYPASAANDDGTIELPVVQVTTDGSLTGFPMYTESNGTALDFKNLCGILRLRLQKNGVSVTAIEVTGDIELTGDFNVTYNGGAPTIAYSGHGTKTTMLTCSTPQSISNQKDFYLFLPDHTYTGMRIRIYSSDGGICTKTLNATQSISIQRSKITTITMSNGLTFSPNADALPGLFTIDAEGHQVRFSQGNLQYTTLGTHAGTLGDNMPGIWRFASEQYLSVGQDNENISETYPKWIDLFGWGTGNNPTTVSVNDGDYQTFVDWGTNAICNGGGQDNMWRTLSLFDELRFIMNDRIDADLKWGIGNVDGNQGLILLPDNWVLPTECTFTPGVTSSYDDWSLNNYTLSQWRAMELNGAVFLPAAGGRHTRSWNYGVCGIYATTTAWWGYQGGVVGNDKFYSQGIMTFYGNMLGTFNSISRTHGASVRLVQNVE